MISIDTIAKAWNLGGLFYQIYFGATVIMGLGLVIWTWALVLDKPGPSAMPAKPAPTATHSGSGDIVGRDKIIFQDQEKNTPSVRVRYTSAFLPIKIPPQSTAFILQLNPDINRWAFEATAKSSEALWPTDLEKDNLEQIYVCELINHGDKDLLDVTVVFDVGFYDKVEVPAKGTKNPDGTFSVSFPFNTAEGKYVYMSKVGTEVKAYKQNNLLRSHKRPITLPAIEAHSNSRIYLVNQSKHIAQFSFPRAATALVSGGSQKKQIPLIRPEVNVQDIMPGFALPPTSHEWRGLPDPTI